MFPTHHRQRAASFLRAGVAVLIATSTAALSAQGPLNEEFVKAAAKGDLAALNVMLQQGVDVNAVNRNGETALMEAARTGKNDVVTALIKAGAGLDLQNKDGSTAVMRAVFAAQAATLKTLVAVGARTDITNKKGETALELAVLNGTANVRPEILTILAASGGDWSGKTIKGEPVLVYAIDSLMSEMAKAMLKSGADPNVRSRRGKPALVVAAERGNLDDGAQAALALIGAGADVNARDRNNHSALEAAVTISKADYANARYRKNCAMIVYGLTSRGADDASIAAARKVIDANGYVLFASIMADGIAKARTSARADASRSSTTAPRGSSADPGAAQKPSGIAKGKPLDTSRFTATLPDGWEVLANDLDKMGMMTLARKGTGGSQGVYVKFEGNGAWDGTPEADIAAFAKSQKGTPPAKAIFNGIPFVQTAYDAYGTHQTMMVTKKAGTKITLTIMGDDYTKSAEVKLFLDTLQLK